MSDSLRNYDVLRVAPLHTISLKDESCHVSLNMDKLQTGRQKTEAMVALIRAMFNELELCGYVTVSADDHMAHALHMEADWCKLEFKMHDDGTLAAMRLRSKAAEYKDKQMQQKDLQATLGMLNGFTMTMGPIALALAEASSQFDKHTGAQHNHERVGDV